MNFIDRSFFVVIWFGILARVLFALHRLNQRESLPPINREIQQTVVVTKRYATRVFSVATYAAWLSLLLYIYRRGFSSENIVGGDWGTWPVPSLSKTLFPFPSLWNFNELGSSNLAGAALYPIESIAGIFVRLRFSYGLAEHFLFFWPPVLCFFASGVIVARRLGQTPSFAGAVGFLIAVSTPVGAFMAGGWFPILMGAAFIVPIISLIDQAPTPRRIIGAGLLAGIDVWFDPRNAVVLALAIVLLIVTNSLIREHRSWSVLNFLRYWPALLIALSLQAGWIFPLIMGARASLPPSYLTSSSAVTFSFNSLGNGMSWFNYAWPELQAGQIEKIPLLFMAVPLLILVGILKRRLSRFELCLLVIFLVTSVLAGGANPPFGAIYVFLFEHLPGVDLYRDDSVYLPYCVVTSAIFVAFGLRSVAEFIFRVLVLLWKRFTKYSSVILPFTFVALIISITSLTALPISNGTVVGDIGSVGLSKAENEINHFLVQQSGNNVWVPQVSGLAPRGSQLSPNLSAATLDDLLVKMLGLTNGASSLFWLNSISDVVSTAQQFGIGHLLIDENSKDYSNNSQGDWIRKRVVPMLQEQFCALSNCPQYGKWVVIPVSPITIVSGMNPRVSNLEPLSSSGRNTKGFLKNNLLAQDGFQLPKNQCFAENELEEPQWSAAGNADNFQHLTTTGSGLFERAEHPHAITIGIRSGSAAISRSIEGCKEIANFSSTDLVIIQLSFESTQNAIVGTTLTLGDETGECQFVASRFAREHKCLISFPSVRDDQNPALVPSLTLDVTPTDDPSPSQPALATFYSAKVLIDSKRAKSALHPSVFARPIPSLRIAPNFGYRLEAPKNGIEDLIFFQSYDKNWVATIQQKGAKPQTLVHFDALGWANGYKLPSTIHGKSTLRIFYKLQGTLNVGMTLTAIIFFSLIFLLVLLAFRSRRLGRETNSS